MYKRGKLIQKPDLRSYTSFQLILWIFLFPSFSGLEYVYVSFQYRQVEKAKRKECIFYNSISNEKWNMDYEKLMMVE